MTCATFMLQKVLQKSEIEEIEFYNGQRVEKCIRNACLFWAFRKKRFKAELRFISEMPLKHGRKTFLNGFGDG